MVSDDAAPVCVCIYVCVFGPCSPITFALQEEINMGSVLITEYIKTGVTHLRPTLFTARVDTHMSCQARGCFSAVF